MRQGDSFNERLRAAGAHRRRPPGPPATGDALLGNWHLRPAAPNTRPCALLASGTQAPSSSQSPLYSGRPSMGIRHVASLLLLSPPNPLRWALAGTPIKCPRCTDTACSGIAVAAGPPDHRRTKQVGRHQAVCVRVAMPSNFDGNRPQWAENRRGHGQSLGRRKIPKIQRDTSP